MKKAVLFFVVFVCSFAASADEFVVRSFVADITDLSAVMYPRTDVNDDLCALVKIRTDLRNLRFDSNRNIVGDVLIKNGEFWLYLSPGEKQIVVYKEGFITLKYNIPIVIEASKVYLMEITNSEKATAATGSMIIETIPAGATVEIAQLNDLKKITPAQLNNYPAFPYSVVISKARYKTVDTILTIQPDEEIVHIIQLKPLWGDLIITVEPKDADIFIDNVYFGNGPQQLVAAEKGIETGLHTFMVRKAGYYPDEKTLDLKRGDNGTLSFSLKQISGTLQIAAEPAGAEVYLDGIFIGNPPISQELQIGEHRLKIQKEGYLTIEKNIQINENQTTVINEVLPNTRLVRITSFPAEAEIYLNGKFAGKTPQKVLVSYGQNTVVLKREHFADKSETIVADAQTESFDFALEAAKYNVLINSSVTGANVFVEKTLVGATPVNVSLPFGQYQVTLEKDGYFKKRKFIDVKDNYQSVTLTMATLSNFRFGAVYGMKNWGGEFSLIKRYTGWGIGVHIPYPEKFTQEIQNKNINPDDYDGLYPAYSLGRESNSDSAQFALYFKGQFALRDVPTLAITIGFGLRFLAYSDVYLADQDYESYYNSDIIYEGSYFSVPRESITKFSPIVGASLRIFRYLYVSADCWFNTEDGTQILVGGGICLPYRK